MASSNAKCPNVDNPFNFSSNVSKCSNKLLKLDTIYKTISKHIPNTWKQMVLPIIYGAYI